MEDQNRREPPSPTTSFLQLPLEIRNVIYDLLIQAATVDASRSLSDVLQRPKPLSSCAHRLDLQMSTKKIRYPNLRLPSNLMYTSHQIYAEFSTLICSGIHSLQLAGDFMMGFSSTASIFDSLARRPWIAKSIRTVNVRLRLSHVLPVLGGVTMNRTVLEQRPWLEERLNIAELKVYSFEMKASGKQLAPQGWWQVIRSKDWLLKWFLGTIGVKMPVAVIEREPNAEEGHEHNTLPDLARLFETFPQLEKIDIETEHGNLLSLFPASKVTPESFRELDNQRVEVNVLVKHWQMYSFSNMLYRNGIEEGTLQFGDESAHGRVALSYEIRPGVFQEHREHRIVNIRLLDYVVRSEDEIEISNHAEIALSKWQWFGGMFRGGQKRCNSLGA